MKSGLNVLVDENILTMSFPFLFPYTLCCQYLFMRLPCNFLPVNIYLHFSADIFLPTKKKSQKF
jgi:hypothetical protein